jgi:branched-chain amino acid transport system permease protein
MEADWSKSISIDRGGRTYYVCSRLFQSTGIDQTVLDAQKDVREPLSVLLLTAAFAVVIENLALIVFGADYVMAQTSFSEATLAFGPVTVSAPRFYALIITLVVAAIFYVFMMYSEMGRVLRATGQDRNTASIMGINITNTYAIAFGLGTALLSVAGWS